MNMKFLVKVSVQQTTVFAHEIKDKYTFPKNMWSFHPVFLKKMSPNTEALPFILPELFPYLILIIIPDQREERFIRHIAQIKF